MKIDEALLRDVYQLVQKIENNEPLTNEELDFYDVIMEEDELRDIFCLADMFENVFDFLYDIKISENEDEFELEL